MKNLTIATLTAALLFGATACSTGGAPTTDPGSTPATAATKAPAPAVEPAPAPSPEDDGIATFGQTWKYDDGVTITVSKPAAGVATETSTNPGAKLSVFTFTIMNGTKAAVKPFGNATITYGADGLPADQVFDSAQGFGDMWPSTILPGKKATIKAAFAMPSTEKDVTLTIAPDFAHADAVFAAK